MKKLLFKILALVFVLICQQCYCQYDFWGDLEPGEFKTGYKRIFAVDTTRVNVHSADPKGRPIIINVWYPISDSSASGLEPMIHSEYLNFSSEVLSDSLEQQFYDYNLEMIEEYSFNSFRKTWKWKVKKLTKKIIENPTHAFKNADYPSGKFPLLIYHQGLGASIEDNAAMIEWLCSHGYVIVNASYQCDDIGYLNVGWELDISINDIDFMVNHLSQFPFIDFSKMGIMGQSYGGQASLAYAVLGRHNVSGVITFDSTIDYSASYTSEGFTELFDPLLSKCEIFNIPLLAIAGDEAIFAITDSLVYSPRTYVKVQGMAHEDYISQGAVGAFLEGETLLKKKYRSFFRQRWKNYLHVCRHTLDFWNHVFQESPSSFEPQWTSIENANGEAQFEYSSREMGENKWKQEYLPVADEEKPIIDGQYKFRGKKYSIKTDSAGTKILDKNGSFSELLFFYKPGTNQVVLYMDDDAMWWNFEVSEQRVVNTIKSDNLGKNNKMVRVD
ncbi:MAG: hypothetical protein WBG42_00865 [Cryomorphaceae bacterium]